MRINDSYSKQLPALIFEAAGARLDIRDTSGRESVTAKCKVGGGRKASLDSVGEDSPDNRE